MIDSLGEKYGGHLSRLMTKQDFCLCGNKGADQLCCNCTAHWRLCFHYTDSTVPPLPIAKNSRFLLSSVTAQTGLCRTCSGTPKSGFLGRGAF